MSTINRLEELKRKNRRGRLISEFSGVVKISSESFFDIENNKRIVMNIYDKIKDISDKSKFSEKISTSNVVSVCSNLEMNLKKVPYSETRLVILIFREREIEAVKVNIGEVIKNLQKILVRTRFLEGYSDFILVQENLEHGIGIERTEYFYEISMW